MEKKLIQELETSSENRFTTYSKNTFSNPDLFTMHKILLNCADSFTEYLNKTKEPIRFTDNVVPLKKEFIKFTTLPERFQTLFGDL